jgi:hypothetical protein
MNEQERQVITDIFRRLEQAANQPRDPEAERLIAEKIREQPYAPYAMAQAVFVQEQALANLNAEVEQLRAEVEDLRSRPQPGGFLAGIFGGGSREPEPPRRPMGAPFGQPQGRPAPWGGQQDTDGRPGPWGGGQAGPQPGMMGQGGPFAQRGGSGFLGTALTTAAGVAGGMMLGNVLTNAFKGSGAEGAGAGTGAGGEQASFLSGAGADKPDAGITDGMYQNAGHDQDGLDADYGSDAGGDFGGGDDWA